MNLDRISFRTDEKERQFLSALNQRYGKKTATALMHAVLADYMGKIGANPANNVRHDNANSVKTMPDSATQDRRSEGESPAHAFAGVAAPSQPTYYRRNDSDELPALKQVKQWADWMEHMARLRKARDEFLGLR